MRDRGRLAAKSRRWRSGLAVFAMAIAEAGLYAQQTSPPQPVPETQHGQSEQVHTGTTSGLDSEARLEALLGDHQFVHIESELPQMSPQQAQFYRGILANRNNDPKASIQLLEPLLEKVAAGGNTAEEKILRKALAEDYLRSGDMA